MEEAEHSGEKFSSAELKSLIFDKIPSEIAATLRKKQSEEKVKTWWAEVEGFDASANKFSVREALQKCSPTSFSKVKFTEETWKIKFHEHEDRDLFVQVLNRGVSFHGHRLKAKNWVFSYTPKELWECCGLFLGNSAALLCLFVSQNPKSKIPIDKPRRIFRRGTNNNTISKT